MVVGVIDPVLLRASPGPCFFTVYFPTTVTLLFVRCCVLICFQFKNDFCYGYQPKGVHVATLVVCVLLVFLSGYVIPSV